MASHQLAKFGDHRHCGSRYMMILVCHVISQDRITLSYRLVKFIGHRHHGSEDIMILVSYTILQDCVTKWSCDFMVRSSSR